ncbi:hypothetical protein [Euzebya tangerina]|uniref:hypothetical protein n=1 Tax=Euzebya tangerina TaxID=591198 RepID=UPI000E314087|nr:hypothetical protein [Euzebya tangerina]
MATKIRVWLNDDRTEIHHADSGSVEGMQSAGADGATDCGRSGHLSLVHHENVDMGKLCAGCLAVSGTRPALEGNSYGPV